MHGVGENLCLANFVHGQFSTGVAELKPGTLYGRWHLKSPVSIWPREY